MKEILQLLSDFKSDRPTMKDNNTLPILIDLLAGELQEAREASLKELPSEIADVIIYGLLILQELTDDPEEEIKTKIALNHACHSAFWYQDGDFETNRLKAKKWFNDRKIRGDF